MEAYYCKICDKAIIHKSRSRHNKTKRHYYLKNYVTKNYNYNDIVWGDVEKYLHENIISHKSKFNEFKIIVSCKINDDIEIEVYKDEHDLCVVLDTFLGVDTIYVHVAGKIVCNNILENLSSRYNTKCTHIMHIKNLSVKFVYRYDNMTYRYQLEQRRPMIESKMIKPIKYMSHEEQINNYNFLTYKLELSLI